jgi:hypothetical protein
MTLEELDSLVIIAEYDRVDGITVPTFTLKALLDLASQVDSLLHTARRVTTKYRGEPDEDEWLISDDVLKELQKAYDELEGK